MERVLANQIGPHPGKVTFRQVGIAPEQRNGNDAVENPVADELQALVVGNAKTAMRQRSLQQGPISEGVPERRCQR